MRTACLEYGSRRVGVEWPAWQCSVWLKSLSNDRFCWYQLHVKVKKYNKTPDLRSFSRGIFFQRWFPCLFLEFTFTYFHCKMWNAIFLRFINKLPFVVTSWSNHPKPLHLEKWNQLGRRKLCTPRRSPLFFFFCSFNKHSEAALTSNKEKAKPQWLCVTWCWWKFLVSADTNDSSVSIDLWLLIITQCKTFKTCGFSPSC